MAQTVWHVSGKAELKAALALATGGETILLDAGDYGNLIMGSRGISTAAFGSEVILRSADPDHPAFFTSALLDGARNVTFEDVDFALTYKPGNAIGTVLASVDKSQNITFTRATFTGDDAYGTGTSADGYPAGFGLNVTNSKGIIVQDSKVTGLWKGVSFAGSTNIVLTGTDIHDFRSDGINLVDVQNVLIENNHIHDIRRSYESGDHSDMIQMWAVTSNPAKVSRDVTITGNILDIGDGGWSQSIFITNNPVERDGAGDAFLYRNITITENVIINDHVTGIRVSATDGLVVDHNTLVHSDDVNIMNGKSTAPPRIQISELSHNVTIQDNATPKVVGYTSQSDWTVSGNVQIQDTNPTGNGYYGNVFVNALTDRTNNLPNLQVLPGSPLDLAGAGAAMLRYDNRPDTLTALIHPEASTFAALMHFDAGLSAGPGGPATADSSARFLWDFGDGATAEGVLVSHMFATSGPHLTTLTVVMPDGSTAQSEARVDIPVVSGPGPVLLDLESTPLVLGHDHVAALLNEDTFQIRMGLAIDDPMTGPGLLLNLDKVLAVEITAAGELRVTLTPATGAGPISVTSSGAHLLDGGWHDIDLHHDGSTYGKGLDVTVDGAVRGHLSLSGGLAPGLGDLQIGGSPGVVDWSSAQLRRLDIDVAAEDLTPPPDASLLAEIAFDPPAGLAVLHNIPDVFDFGVPESFNLDTADPDLLPSTLNVGAELVADATGVSMILHDGSHVNFGRLTEIEDSQQLAIRLDFTALEDSGRQMLVSNPWHLNIEVINDRFLFSVSKADGSMYRQYTSRLDELRDDPLGPHQLLVTVDADADILRATLGGEQVLEITHVDLQLADISARESGWRLGNAWSSSASRDVEISAFQIFDFSDHVAQFGDALMV